jgi:hypothetical protein
MTADELQGLAVRLVGRLMDMVDPGTVVSLLERVVHPPLRTPIPSFERETWNRVGADFRPDPRRELEGAVEVLAEMSRLERESYVGVAALAAELDIDPSRVSQLVSAGRVLHWFRRDRTAMFPRWQVVAGTRLAGVAELVRSLRPGIHPLTVDRWAHSPNVDLEIDGEPVSPLVWLRTGGDPQMTARLAAAL